MKGAVLPVYEDEDRTLQVTRYNEKYYWKPKKLTTEDQRNSITGAKRKAFSMRKKKKKSKKNNTRKLTSASGMYT